MKILSMHILYKGPSKPVMLKTAFELGFINFVKRQMAQGPLKFAARTCASKINRNETVKVELTEVENACLYAHVNGDGICSIIITDMEYPESAAKRVLLEMQKGFLNLYSVDLIKQYDTDQDMKYPQLDEMIKKYQDPKQADKLIKIESELNEIQGMLTKTMEDLLDRGEKLDDLMKQSDDISSTAYNFYSKTKDANKKCCSIY